jgi:small-conductance mechanosensitive channel
MSKETNTKDTEKPQLTPEQVEAQRIIVMNYYTNQVQVLTVQAEYEKLLANIEESRAKRLEMVIRQAQMQAPPEPQEPEEEFEAEEAKLNPRKRVLKKD